MVRTVHNRASVSAWHAALDQAGLEALQLPATTQPYCAIERTGPAGSHKARWPRGETPTGLAPVFDVIMALHGQEF